MNENFLQDNPLKLFDDFVQIPDQAFEDGRDIVEINSLILQNLITTINNSQSGLAKQKRMSLALVKRKK